MDNHDSKMIDRRAHEGRQSASQGQAKTLTRVVGRDERIPLVGFNNLTKALSFNLYDFCIARNESERASYMEYIAQRYAAARVTDVLKGICGIIEARVLAISDQDYEPWGASSLVLMSDLKGGGVTDAAAFGGLGEGGATTAMHLDKSHICAHTYPDFHGGGTICSFRVDIDIATCGEITPLNALNFMFERFDSDVVVIDYVVRGFTRDAAGRRVYMDHPLRSIQEYISPGIRDQYQCADLNMGAAHIWQTRMLRMRHDVSSYFRDPVDSNDAEVVRYMETIRQEMSGIYHME